jgi:predicted porin
VRPALLSVSVGACAQSSITLFGLLDEELNFTYNAGGSKAYQMTSNDLVTSRWGLKGTEDFGAVQTINRL